MAGYLKGLVSLSVLAAVMASGAPASARADVGVSFSFHVGPPPVFAAPPAELAVIPRTDIYFVPHGAADVFFYGGYWWAPRGPRWYRSYALNGPWVIVSARHVPPSLYRIPPDYRVVYRRAERLPYHHWRKTHGEHRHGKHRHRDRWQGGHGHGDRW